MKTLIITGFCLAMLLSWNLKKVFLQEKNNSPYTIISLNNKIKDGTVKGVIDPPEANVTVTITANGRSFKTKTTAGGEFLIENVPEGTYAISFSSAAWIYKANLSEVIVTSGMITDMGIVNVSQP